jgi:hypothetical protein
MATMQAEGWWLYGVAGALPAELRGAPGVDGAPLEAVALAPGAVAVAGRVPLDAWTGPRAEEALQDLQALAPKLERHLAIQRSLHARGPLLPVRFGALFSTEEALRAALSSEGLPPSLITVGDREEWAVQAWVGPAPTPQDHDAPSGTAWMLRKRRAAARERQATEARRQALEALGAALEARCHDATVLPLPPRVEDTPDTPLANWALLADRGAGEGLAAVLEAHREALAAHRTRLRLTGPWPPASFCPALGESRG